MNRSIEQNTPNKSNLHRRVDLHCHSTYSDGTLTPLQLLDLAIEQKIELFALTDHDTIAGLDELKKNAQELGIAWVSGVEISTQWQGIPIHLVALNFDLAESRLLEILNNNQMMRIERAQKIAQLLIKKGLPDLYDAAVTLAGKSQLGRPHFAKVMVEQGLVKDVNKAFDRYLGNKHIGKIREVWPSLEDIVKQLSTTSMDLVLAHPRRYQMTATKLRRMVADFKANGGTAMEVSSGNEKPDNVRFLERLVRENGLKASVGSDYHGPFGPWSQLGKYTPIDEASVPTVWQTW